MVYLSLDHVPISDERSINPTSSQLPEQEGSVTPRKRRRVLGPTAE